METRYEAEGEVSPAAADLGALSASLSSMEAVEGSDDLATLAGSGASFGRSYEDSDDPYAWAQRLRDIPDKVRIPVLCLAAPLWNEECLYHPP